MNQICIGLGSNLGDREANLNQAILELRARSFEVISVSSWIETPPMYNENQPNFLNGCAHLQTRLPSLAVLDALLEIELSMGRVRTEFKGPRIIDLDLLFYDDEVLDVDGLTIPHPGILERDFVLVPLAEIVPDWIHPVKGQRVQDLLHVLKGH